MINKIYKRIHSKYLNFFNFFFFLRYVFAIFLIAISLFLLIPKLFDYEKKQELIKQYLFNNYDLQIEKYSSKSYHIFPLPNLSIKNATLKVKDKPLSLKTKDLKIFLTLKNIYNFKDFEGNKIILEEAELALNIDHSKDLLNYFRKLEKRLLVKDLKLNFKKNDKPMFKIKKINFSNYGYQKYKISGQMFDKKFKAHLKDDNKKLHFKILNTGIKADFKFRKRSPLDFISGSSNVKFLNNYLKFDFNFDNNNIEITKTNFKNKNLSVSFDSLITFNPFFGVKSITNINEINSELIEGISLKKILSNKEIIKKLSIDNVTNYSSKKYLNSLIKNYSSKSSLTYGRLIFLNKIFILGGDISCEGDSLLTEEYPRLNFFCKFNINDQKKLFKKFSISKKSPTDPINFDIKGSLNLFNKKINFKKINIGKNYVSNEADTKYFKDNFEKILFNDGFFGIFKMHKLKEFFQAVI